MAAQNVEIIWSPHPRQKALIDCPLSDIGFGGARGGGKGQPYDAQILTPSGYVPMGELILGNRIINPVGCFQIVTGITELGERMIYEAIFSDNSRCKVTLDHLWRCRETEDATGNFSSPPLVLTTQEILDRHRLGYKMRIPTHLVADGLVTKTGKSFRSIVKRDTAIARCISVSHPNQLYVTSDRIVTHNSAGTLGHWIVKSQKYDAAARGLFLRRTIDELDEVQRTATMIFPKLGAQYHAMKRTWEMATGATLRMRYLERDADAEHYQGHEYSDIYVDEAGNFPNSSPIDLIKGANRSTAGVPCQIILTFNPHGVGHAWIKKRYVDPAPPFTPFFDPEARDWRVFIPSLLQDNPSLFYGDPSYVNRLHSATIGKPWLLAGWLHGDWDATPHGTLLNPTSFPRYTQLPEYFDRLILSWDTSQKNQAANDPWAMLAIGERDGLWYIVEVFCLRMNYPEGKRKLRQFVLDYNPSALLIEDKSSGSDLIAELSECFWGRGDERDDYTSQTPNNALPLPPPIFPIMPVGSKVDRMCVQSDVIEGGRVLLPSYAPWLNDFLAKVSAYPKIGLDEMDALSQALKWFRSRPRSTEENFSLGASRSVSRIAARWASS